MAIMRRKVWLGNVRNWWFGKVISGDMCRRVEAYSLLTSTGQALKPCPSTIHVAAAAAPLAGK